MFVFSDACFSFVCYSASNDDSLYLSCLADTTTDRESAETTDRAAGAAGAAAQSNGSVPTPCVTLCIV